MQLNFIKLEYLGDRFKLVTEEISNEDGQLARTLEESRNEELERKITQLLEDASPELEAILLETRNILADADFANGDEYYVIVD